MKGSAKIRSNINLTKINSAWLLWLIQKKVFSESSFARTQFTEEERWTITSSVLCE